jgi:hypothetical protein
MSESEGNQATPKVAFAKPKNLIGGRSDGKDF